MKKHILILSGLLLATFATAQTEVTTGVMRGKDYGVTYMLPKTEIEFTITVTRHIYTPGELCKHATRYLRLNNVSDVSNETWTLDNISTRVIGVPDKDKVYFVKLKDKSSAPLMELTEDGIVRSINMPFSGKKATEQPQEAVVSPASIDPSSFLTQEILLAGSTNKVAELVAKEIYAIRDSRNALLRGEADNMPQDGEQLKLMLENLALQEQAMTEMFAGKNTTETQTVNIRITPMAMKDEVAFRFSRKLGIVASNDLAGEPYYLTITDLKTPGIPESTEEKEMTGVAFNLPGQAQITVTSYDGKTVFDQQLPLTQFGTIEYLAPVLFNKNSTTKVLFDTSTGGVIKVDRE